LLLSRSQLPGRLWVLPAGPANGCFARVTDHLTLHAGDTTRRSATVDLPRPERLLRRGHRPLDFARRGHHPPVGHS
jgi:hypothetical protein